MEKRGTKPNTKKDKRVATLKKAGLSFREIGRVLDEDVKSVYRRYQRVVGRLSTG